MIKHLDRIRYQQKCGLDIRKHLDPVNGKIAKIGISFGKNDFLNFIICMLLYLAKVIFV